MFWIGFPPARSQTHSAKSSPAFCISRKMRAPLMVASILARARMMPGFCEQARDVGFAEAGDLCGIELAEGGAEGFALAQDGDPGEAGLEALEHEEFPERAAVVQGHAPLFIVIGAQERIALGPVAALDGFLFHGCHPT